MAIEQMKCQSEKEQSLITVVLLCRFKITSLHQSFIFNVIILIAKRFVGYKIR